MKYYMFLVLALQSIFVFGQSVPYTINGNIPAWKGKESVALMYMLNNAHVSDTVPALDGKFQFKGKLKEPLSVAVVLISRSGGGTRDNRSIYIDGGTITVNGTDSLKYAKVVGSKLTVENELLQDQLKPVLNRLVAIRIKAGKTSKEDQQRPEFKAVEKEYRNLVDSMRNIRTTFIKKYPKSLISLVALESVVGNPIDYKIGSSLFEGLAPEVKKLPLGVKMAKDLALAKKTNIGEVLPNFTSYDTLRNPLQLQEVVKKGKVTLVDFWASWCAPCRAENPNVVKAFKAFHDQGFNILSVSLDKNEASWKKAIATDGMPWYHVSSLKYWGEPVAVQFGINGVPDNFLLDAEGKVVARGLRGEALYQKIGELINPQGLKKDSLAGVQYKTNILLIDSVYKAFNNEKDVEKRVLIFNRFFDSPKSAASIFGRYKYWMQRDLAQHYASLNQVKASDQWIGLIKDQRTKQEADRLSATAYAEAGNKAQGIKMLKPILDSLLQINDFSNLDNLNLYTYTVESYTHVLGVKGQENQLMHYLKPLYIANGRYFPTDLSKRIGAPELDFKTQLFYGYAKALAATGNSKETAEVLVSAFNLGAVSVAMQKEVIADFKALPGLAKYVAGFSAAAKTDFQKNVASLLAKPDLNDKVWGISAFKGKYVLLDFWGSWCWPCRFSHPHLKEVYSKYKDKGFEIIGVSREASPDLEKAKQSWKKAIDEDQIGWIHLLNNQNVAQFDAVKAFGIGVFPTKILLDRDGKEIVRYSGGSSKELDQKLIEIFSAK